MTLTSTEEYGLRCALQLARICSEPGTVLSASEISEKEGISLQYVSKFMHLFRKAGLVEAERGNKGGFRLKKAAHEISLQEVLSAARAKTGKAFNSKDFCNQFKGQRAHCVHQAGGCSIRPVWQVLSLYFEGFLKELTLSDLLKNENEAREKVLSLVAGSVQESQLRGNHAQFN